MENIMESIEKLLQAIHDSDEPEQEKADDIKSVEEYVNAFPNYFNSVINYVVQGKTIGLRYDGEMYQYEMQKIDSERRQAHINATESINKLNRYAAIFGLRRPVIRTGRELDSSSIDDREVAANLVYHFCIQTFLDEAERCTYTIDRDIDAGLMEMAKHGSRFRHQTKLGKEEKEIVNSGQQELSGEAGTFVPAVSI